MPNPVPPTTTTHAQPRTEREDAVPQCNQAGGLPPPQLPVRARANLPRKVRAAREVTRGGLICIIREEMHRYSGLGVGHRRYSGLGVGVIG